MQSSDSRSAVRRSLPKLFIAMVVIALGVLGWFGFSGKQSAPDVAFAEITGGRVSTADLRGKVVMVNFWATSCTTCVKEMPEMVQTYNKYKGQGLEFVAVAMSYDPPNYVLNYAQTRQLPFRVALDTDGQVARAFGDVKLTPTTYVIDKQGRILKRYVGEPQFAELHQLLEKALAA